MNQSAVEILQRKADDYEALGAEWNLLSLKLIELILREVATALETCERVT